MAMGVTAPQIVAVQPLRSSGTLGIDRGGLTDNELTALLRERDVSALELLYDRYGNAVYSTAAHVIRDPHLAEDVTQDVFTRLWHRPHAYSADRGRFLNWLLSVTRNRAVDYVRRRKRRFRHEAASQEEHDFPAGEREDPALSAELLEARRRIRAILAAMPWEQRRPIELAYFGGHTQREVAQLLGAPLGTIKTRIRAGMTRLREGLQATGERQGVFDSVDN